ncbi:MAG: YXWGXW repeat-containing protein [Bacteroidales bacterium]|nr:YXWGXW repeat-containing protein [Bacteroidales bacterium]MBN2758763.1 YXWGXW repeat-containing protein [Bacteroidales bacterium]
MRKLIIILLFSFLGFSISTDANAQFVKEKPSHPKQIRVRAKHPKPSESNDWVWVPGHWKWKAKSNKYDWVKGDWKKPPKNKKNWIEGNWKKEKKGWVWNEGRWD